MKKRSTKRDNRISNGASGGRGINKNVTQYLIKEHRKRRWHKVVGALAAIVVFVTTYILILPAITLEVDQRAELGLMEQVKVALFGVEDSPELTATDTPEETEAAAPEETGETDAAETAAPEDAEIYTAEGDIAEDGETEEYTTEDGTAEEYTAEDGETDDGTSEDYITEDYAAEDYTTDDVSEEDTYTEDNTEDSEAESDDNTAEGGTADVPATTDPLMTNVASTTVQPSAMASIAPTPSIESIAPMSAYETPEPSIASIAPMTETESGISAVSETETESGISTVSDTAPTPVPQETENPDEGIMTLSEDDTTTVTIPTAQKVIRYATASDKDTNAGDGEVTFADLVNNGLEKYKFAIGGAAAKYTNSTLNHWGTYHLLTTTSKTLGLAGNFSTKFTSLAAYCKKTNANGFAYIANGETNNGYLQDTERTDYSIWYFEKSGDSTYPYYIYTFDGNLKKIYLKMTAESDSSTNSPTASLSLVSENENPTPFSVCNDSSRTYLYQNNNNNIYTDVWVATTKYTTSTNGPVLNIKGNVDGTEYYLGAYYGNNKYSDIATDTNSGYYSQHGFAGMTEVTHNINNGNVYLRGIDLIFSEDTGNAPGDFVFTADPEEGKVTLKWTESSNMITYIVEVYEGNTATGDPINTYNTSNHTYTADGLTAGKEYTFKVIAKNKYGEKEATQAVTAGSATGSTAVTVKPDAPKYTELTDPDTLASFTNEQLATTAFAIAGVDIRKLTDGTYENNGSYHLMTATDTTMLTDNINFKALKPYCYSPDHSERGNDELPVTGTDIENNAIWYFENSGDKDYPYYIVTVVGNETDGYTKKYLSITTTAGGGSTTTGQRDLVLTDKKSAYKFAFEIQKLDDTTNILRLKNENGHYLESYYSDYGWAKHAFVGSERKNSQNAGSNDQTAEISKETGAANVSAYYCGALRLCYVTKEMPEYDTSTYDTGVKLTLNLQELEYNSTKTLAEYKEMKNTDGKYCFVSTATNSAGQVFDRYSDDGEIKAKLPIEDAVKRTASDGTVTYLINIDEINELKGSEDNNYNNSNYVKGSVYRYGVTKFYEMPETYSDQEFEYWGWLEVQAGDVNIDESTYTVYYPHFVVADDTVTPAGTVINMFDYWTTGDDETYRLVSDMTTNGDKGINSNASKLKFFRGSAWSDYAFDYPMNNYTGNTSWYDEYKDGKYKSFKNRPVQGIVANKYDDNDYPQLNGDYDPDPTDDTTTKGYELVGFSSDNPNTASLQYLFDPSMEHAGKKTFKNIKGLFTVDENGYYYFNSRERFAEYNDKTNTFTEYKTPGVYHNYLYGQFFPFNSMGEVYNKCSDSTSDSPVEDGYYDGLNHYLAISMKASFMQENDGYTNTLKTQQTSFEFERGDDFWLFIDGVLIGDAGGLHPVSHVTINFATGVVSQYKLDTTTFGKDSNYKVADTTIYDLYCAAGMEDTVNWTTITLDDGSETKIFENGSKHTLAFYCLERGNGESNLMLKYNLSSTPETKLHKIDEYGNALEDADFAFYPADVYDSTTGDKFSDTNTYTPSTTTTVNVYKYRAYTPENYTKYANNDSSAVYTNITLDDYENNVDGKKYEISGYDESDETADTTTNNYDEGTIVCYSSATDDDGNTAYTVDYVIPRVYLGTTDNAGDLLLADSDGFPYTISELETLFGGKFVIMREIGIPEGYRSIEDEANIYISGGRMMSDNIYESGVWVSNKVQVTAPSTLYAVSDSDCPGSVIDDTTKTPTKREIEYYSASSSSSNELTTNGTLFAVVLRRSVTNSVEDGTQTQTMGAYDSVNKENVADDSWVPVYGTDDDGYTVMDGYSIENVIAAAKAQASYNPGEPENIFSNQNGNMLITFENLPGYTSKYYCYQREVAGNDADKIEKDNVRYVIAYYWTSSTGTDDDPLKNATKDNTWRVSSFDEDYDSDSNTSISVLQKDWGATLTVSNFENKLNVQKLDLDEIPVNGTTFALYKAGQDDHPTKEYEEDTGTLVDVYHTYYLTNDVMPVKVYLKPDEANPNEGIAYIGGYGNGTNGESNEATYTGTYSISDVPDDIYEYDSAGDIAGVKDGVGDIIVTYTDSGNTYTLTIMPAKNAKGDWLVTTTHTCSDALGCDTVGEYGTGHFTYLTQGNYLLREISAPQGYALNSAQTQVLVDEDDVYANAGTSDNGISVGNGTGYVEPLIVKKTDSGNVRYVYGLLNSLSGSYTYEQVSRAAFGDEKNNAGVKTYIAANGSSDVAGLDKENQPNQDIKSNAMVMYLKYSGNVEGVSYDYMRNDIDYLDDSGERVIPTDTDGYVNGFRKHSWTGGGIYPKDPMSSMYKPDDKPDGDGSGGEPTATPTAAPDGGDTSTATPTPTPAADDSSGGTDQVADIKEMHPRMYTTAGWTAISLFQDYEYGKYAVTSSYYEDVTSANGDGDISNLFSHSTFVRVQDESIAEVRVIKTDLGDDGKPGNNTLEGASFILSRTMTKISSFVYDDDGNATGITNGDTVTDIYWAGTDSAGNALWTDDINQAVTLTTGDDGKLVAKDSEGNEIAGTEGFFGGLPDLPAKEKAISEEEADYGYGCYTLTETAAPDGYDLLTGVVTFSVWHGSATDTSVPDNSFIEIMTSDSEDNGARIIQVTVPNATGNELPSTGGSGIWMFIVIGAMLAFVALYGFAMKSRRRA